MVKNQNETAQESERVALGEHTVVFETVNTERGEGLKLSVESKTPRRFSMTITTDEGELALLVASELVLYNGQVEIRDGSSSVNRSHAQEEAATEKVVVLQPGIFFQTDNTDEASIDFIDRVPFDSSHIHIRYQEEGAIGKNSGYSVLGLNRLPITFSLDGKIVAETSAASSVTPLTGTCEIVDGNTRIIANNVNEE